MAWVGTGGPAASSEPAMVGAVIFEGWAVAPGPKDKTRYTPYVSPGSQISLIATNKGNIERQCSIYNVLSIKNITLDSK